MKFEDYRYMISVFKEHWIQNMVNNIIGKDISIEV